MAEMAESKADQDEAKDIADTLKRLDQALLPDGEEDLEVGDGEYGFAYDDDDDDYASSGDKASTTPSDHDQPEVESSPPSEHSGTGTDHTDEDQGSRDEKSNHLVKDEESGETVAAAGAAKEDGVEKNEEDGRKETHVAEEENLRNEKQSAEKKRGERHTSDDHLPPEVQRAEGSATALVLEQPKQRRSSLKKFFKLKRFSLKGKKSKPPTTRMQTMMQVKVDSLPQIFITKYLGMRECKGLYGIKHTREPVDEMVKSVQESGDELPLLELRVSKSGIRVREHKANKSLNYNFDTGLIPIEFLSYGVQDTRFTRVFTFVVVREMSSRAKKLECHAYVCDSSVSARKLALSISLAFKLYSTSVKDKSRVFQVDLGKSEKDAKDAAATQHKDAEA